MCGNCHPKWGKRDVDDMLGILDQSLRDLILPSIYHGSERSTYSFGLIHNCVHRLECVNRVVAQQTWAVL